MSPLSARVSYKKLSGVLHFTDTELTWTQDGQNAPTVRIPNKRAISLFCSKAGAAQVRLKVGLVDDENGHNFTFTAPQATALAEREKFKDAITPILARNRGEAAALPSSSSSSLPSTHTPLRAQPLAAGPTPATQGKSRPASLVASRPASVAAADRATPGIGSPGPSGPLANGASGDQANEFRLKKKVLVADPELAALHRELVMTGQITEHEFWEGREHLLQVQAAMETQRKGRPGTLVDPRPETVDGEIKIVITPQLVHDIFEEYPVVARAYSENVPNQLQEAEFWKRYFQSKLFNAHRASIRSAAAQHVVRDDPIFDRYLEKDDDELEPRRTRETGVDAFIDLGATHEDHGETGNTADVTMQPGRQRATLPLIRKFNEHSERLLKASLGDEPATKRRRLENGDAADRMAELDLDDLHDPQAANGIALQMQDRQRYFEAQARTQAVDSRNNVDAGLARVAVTQATRAALTELSGLKPERRAAESALLSMTRGVEGQVRARRRQEEVPADLLRQMTTCQTAATEFLRQFWLAVYPPPNTPPAAVAQRNQRMTKMAGYLARTPEKVDALVRAAQGHGVDYSRVEEAMKPTLKAVDNALTFHQARQAASASAKR